jgi:hypothetical protein
MKIEVPGRLGRVKAEIEADRRLGMDGEELKVADLREGIRRRRLRGGRASRIVEAGGQIVGRLRDPIRRMEQMHFPPLQSRVVVGACSWRVLLFLHSWLLDRRRPRVFERERYSGLISEVFIAGSMRVKN